MSRSQGLGSPHIPGDGQPSRQSQRRGRILGCLAAPFFIVFLVVAGMVALAAVVFVLFVIPEWIVGSLPPTLVAALMGLFLVVVGFGPLILIAARPDRRRLVPPIRMLLSIVVFVFLGLMGIGMLVYALTQPTTSSSF